MGLVVDIEHFGSRTDESHNLSVMHEFTWLLLCTRTEYRGHYIHFI